MRKIITILALVLTVALCASFAASAVTVSGLSSATTEATVNYTAAGNDPEKVYSVDVTWNDVEFSYNAGTKQWNPSTHEYDDAANGTQGSWTESTGTVTVANHSNAAVKATVTFETSNNGTATVSFSNGGVINLDTAEGKATNAAPSGSTTLTASGAPTANGKIGTVKVTITAAN